MRGNMARRGRRVVRVATMFVARSRPGGRLAQIVCAHAPALLPAERVMDAGGAVVIRHPLPEFPGHLVVVPKAYVRSLCALVASRRLDVFRDLLAAARLAAPLAGDDVLLSINMGGRQEVAQLHAHLVPVARARVLLGGTVWTAPLDLDDPERLLAVLAEATRAAGGCDPHVDGSLVLLGFAGPTPELRVSRAGGSAAPPSCFVDAPGAPPERDPDGRSHALRSTVTLGVEPRAGACRPTSGSRPRSGSASPSQSTGSTSSRTPTHPLGPTYGGTK